MINGKCECGEVQYKVAGELKNFATAIVRYADVSTERHSLPGVALPETSSFISPERTI